MITEIIVEEGKIGLKAKMQKRKYAAQACQTLNHLQAKEILTSSGHQVDKCIENISIVISNSGDDHHPFENIWWFSVPIVETKQQKPKTTRTRRTRKTKDEQQPE